jgi:hypothetical protein
MAKKKQAKPMGAHTRQAMHRSVTKQLSAMIVRCSEYDAHCPAG